MKKIAIVTDSNSGITQEMGKTMGIHVIPMPFFIDGELFLEDITLTQEEFYKRLGEDSDPEPLYRAPDTGGYCGGSPCQLQLSESVLQIEGRREPV